MTAREWWKKYYRACRIARKVAVGCELDMMLYGASLAKVIEVDGCRTVVRVNPKEWFKEGEVMSE